MANFQLQDSQKVSYAVAEFDKDGNIDPPGAGDVASVVSDSPSSLTVVPDTTVDPAKLPNNADGSPANPANYLQTGFLVGGATLKTGAAVTLSINHADGTPGPASVTLLVDVVVGPAVTSGLSLGTPVNQ